MRLGGKDIKEERESWTSRLGGKDIKEERERERAGL